MILDGPCVTCYETFFFIVFDFGFASLLAIFFVSFIPGVCILESVLASPIFFTSGRPFGSLGFLSDIVIAICEDLLIIGYALPRDIGCHRFNFTPSSTVIAEINKVAGSK